MLDHEFREQGPPQDFDNTMIGNYISCPRNLYWFLRGVVSDSTPPYFTFGRAFGQGINMWHETQDSSFGFDTRVAMAQKVAEDIWIKENPIERGNDTYSNLASMIDTYCEVYARPEN